MPFARRQPDITVSRRDLLRGVGAGALVMLSPSAARGEAGPADERVLDEARSPYNLVRVAERGTVRTMYVVNDDGTQYIETRVDRAYPASLDLDVFRTMMAGFLIQPRPKRLLVLGLGGGAICNYLYKRIPDIDIDAVDIDPVVVRFAQTYFGVPREDPRFRVHVMDARQYVERHVGDGWDMIMLDAFIGVKVPRHLRTAEFHAAVLARLTTDGVVVANLHNRTPTYPFDRATFAAAYPRRHAFRSEEGNQTTLVASRTQVGAYTIRAGARAVQPNFDFDMLGLAARYYYHQDWPGDAAVLRDEPTPGPTLEPP